MAILAIFIDFCIVIAGFFWFYLASKLIEDKSWFSVIPLFFGNICIGILLAMTF